MSVTCELIKFHQDCFFLLQNRNLETNYFMKVTVPFLQHNPAVSKWGKGGKRPALVKLNRCCIFGNTCHINTLSKLMGCVFFVLSLSPSLFLHPRKSTIRAIGAGGESKTSTSLNTQAIRPSISPTQRGFTAALLKGKL